MTHAVRRSLRFAALCVCASVTLACAARPPIEGARPVTADAAIRYDAAALARAEKILVLTPGALNPLAMFGPRTRWADAGYAVVGAPMPGVDGAPIHPLKIRRAAERLVEIVETAPGKPVHFIAFSAGAPIALETASRIAARRETRVAVFAGLPGFPAAFKAGARAARDVVGIALGRGGIDFGAAWDEYYITLLFGRGAHRDPVLRRRAEAIRAARGDGGALVKPSVRMLRAQIGDIAFWCGEITGDLAGARVIFYHGEKDPIIRLAEARRFAEIAPNRRFEVIENRGHMLLRSNPELLDVALDALNAPDPPGLALVTSRP